MTNTNNMTDNKQMKFIEEFINDQITDFSTENMATDLGADVDNLIKDFTHIQWDTKKILGKCCNCEEEDIDNEYNFKDICYSCNNKLCFKCFEDLKNNDFELNDIEVYNLSFGNWEKDENEDFVSNEPDCDNRDGWICGDCGIQCENCEDYFDEYTINCLHNIQGDIEHCCGGCINRDELDIVRNNQQNKIYTRDEVVDATEYIACEDCGNVNYAYEFIGDNEDDDIHYSNSNEYDADCENSGNYTKEINEDLQFFKIYDEDKDKVIHICEGCCETDLRYL